MCVIVIGNIICLFFFLTIIIRTLFYLSGDTYILFYKRKIYVTHYYYSSMEVGFILSTLFIYILEDKKDICHAIH